MKFLTTLISKLLPSSGGGGSPGRPPRFDEAVHQRLRAGLGADLPPDYLRFLRSYDDEVPEPNFFWVVPGDWGSGIEGFYVMREANEECGSLLQAVNWDGLPLKPGLIPIGGDGSFGYVLLILRPEDHGSVHFCTTWSDDGKTDVYESQGYWRVADNFGDFLARLQDPPDEE